MQKQKGKIVRRSTLPVPIKDMTPAQRSEYINKRNKRYKEKQKLQDEQYEKEKRLLPKDFTISLLQRLSPRRLTNAVNQIMAGDKRLGGWR